MRAKRGGNIPKKARLSKTPPRFEVPTAKRVLFIAPHMDDETLACGGIIRLYTQSGIPVQVVFLTDGSRVLANHPNPQRLIKIRKKEAQQAADILGYGESTFLDLPDGQLAEHSESAKNSLKTLLASFQPDIIYTPSPIDIHPDHIAASRITRDVSSELPEARIAFYSVYQPVRANVFVPIESVQEIKERAINVYQTSLVGKPQVFCAAVHNSNQSWLFQTGVEGSFEPLWVVPATISERKITEWLTCRDIRQILPKLA